MNQSFETPAFLTTVTFGMDGLITVNDDLTIVQFNLPAESILGFCANDVIGRPLPTLFDENSKSHHEFLASLQESGISGQDMAEHKLVNAKLANGQTVSLTSYTYQTIYDNKRYFTAVFKSKNSSAKREKQRQNGNQSFHNSSTTGLFNNIPTVTPYSQLFSKIGIIEQDLVGENIFWSDEVYEILGLDSKKTRLSSDLFLDYVHPEDQKLVRNMRSLHLSNNKKYVIRHRLLLNNNETKYVECRCETFVEKSNKAVRSLVVIRDISDQVNTFQQQCCLQELFLKTEELSKTGSWEINLDKNQYYFSPEYVRLHNVTSKQLLHEDLYSIAHRVHAHDRELFLRYMKNGASSNVNEPIIYRVTNKNGTTKYIKAKSELVKTNNDNTKSIYGFSQDITSYFNSEQNLQKGSELLRAVIDTTHTCIAHLDRDMNFVLVNKAYADADNKSPDYFVGKNHFDLYPNTENEAIFRNVIKTGLPYTANAKPFQYKHNPERGVTHWDWTATPIKDNIGKTTGLVLTLLNVTDLIKALEDSTNNEKKLIYLNSELENIIRERTSELEDERNFIDAVLETQGAYVTVLNNLGHIAIFNNACEINTGYDKKELSSKPLWDILVPEEEKADVIKVFNTLINTGQPSHSEHHWKTKTGETRMIKWSNSVLKDSDGQARYVIMTGIDITESRKTELLLKRAAGNLEVAQRITKIGDWEYDVPNKKLSWSDEYFSILGLESSNHTPSKELYLNCVHENDRQQATIGIKQLIDKGYKDITLRIVTPAGETRIVHEIAQVEFNKSGKPLFLRGTIQDITDIATAAAERNQLQRQLQQAHKMESIGQLTGGIAHDFNNILAAILGFTRLAKTRFTPDSKGDLADYLQEIEKASLRASSLVKQMLAFSRGDTQDFTHLDPLPIIKETVNMLRSTISSSINIIVELNKENYFIETNALQLQQTIINLIINSRDALQGKGEIYITVGSVNKPASECVSCHKLFSGEYLAITVKDNGSGIQPEILPRIFEPFFTTKSVGNGTGMGLSMVHGFMHSSNGHISVEINAGYGTAFSLYFPISAKDINESRENTAYKSVDPGPNKLPEYKLLAVDDEESVVKYFKELLSMHNYEVETTTSSREALNLIKSNPGDFDLLITDQSMPELSGDELIKEIRKISAEMPIILCSGYSDKVNKDNYKEKGATFFLSKPIDQKLFLETILHLLEKSRIGQS